MSDSLFHFPKFSVESFKDIGALTEALWMIYNKDDNSEIPKMEVFRTFFRKKSKNLLFFHFFS